MAVTVIEQAHQSSLASQRLQAVLEIWEQEKAAHNYHWLYVCARHQGEKMRSIWVRANENAFDYFEQELVYALSKATSFEVEILHSPDVRHLNPSAKNQWNSLRGKQAMEIDFGGKITRWAATEMIARNLSFSNALNRHLAGIKPKFDPQASIPVTLYQNKQWFCDNSSSPQSHASPVDMFRGNRVVKIESVNRETVLRCAQGMTRWLAAQVNDTGAASYKYWPSRGAYASSNNAIRQWMATLCLGRAAKFFGSEQLATIAAKNLAYNVSTTYKTDGEQSYIWMNGSAKLGAAALAALAILESPQRKQYLNEEYALYSMMCSLGIADGSFDTFYIPRERKDNQNFYSGEALLFLAARYSASRNPEELKRIMAAFRYYREWHLQNRNPAFVPWHTQAYFLVWRITKDDSLKDFIFEMNDWLLSMQQWDTASHADMRGRFYDPERPQYGPPHASSTGVYLEGLIDAFALAKACGDLSRAENYRVAIVRGMRSIMQLQFKDEVDCFYVKTIERVIGAVRTTVYDNTIRIDNVQHALMALLKIHDRFSEMEFFYPMNRAELVIPGRTEQRSEVDQAVKASSSLVYAYELACILGGVWLNAPDRDEVVCGFSFEEKFFEFGNYVICTNSRDWGANSYELENRIDPLVLKGAAGFIVSKQPRNLPERPVLLVDNTRQALSKLAKFYRQRISAKVIVITGSVGKTTTRSITRKMLDALGVSASTCHNYNLNAGVELSLVNTPLNSEYTCYEVAIGAPGSITTSAELLNPDVVIFTEITAAHLASHKSLDNIIREKALLLDGSPAPNVVVLYRDSKSYQALLQKSRDKGVEQVVTYGESPEADVRLVDYLPKLGGADITIQCNGCRYSVPLSLPGKHNALNALAALAGVMAVSPASEWKRTLPQIANAQTPAGRMEHHALTLPKRYTLINDSFNANPLSMAAAVEYACAIKSQVKGRIVLAIADMLELGAATKAEHKALAEKLNMSRVDLVYTMGSACEYTFNSLSAEKKGKHYSSVTGLYGGLSASIQDNDVVLIKGSHGSKIYKVADKLINFASGLPGVHKPVVPDSLENVTLPTLQNDALNPDAEIVLDTASGEILHGRNIDELIFPASLTRIMALYLIFEKVERSPNLLNKNISISKQAANTASPWRLKEGQVVKVEDLILASAIASSNAATVALAEWHSATESHFALHMTQLARKLGLRKTICRNSTGLHNPGQVTTLRELSIASCALLKRFPGSLRIFSKDSFIFNGERVANTSKPLGGEGVTVLKSARTPKYGFNLAVTSLEDGKSRLVIVVGRPKASLRDEDARSLIKRAYSKSIGNIYTDLKFTRDPSDKKITLANKPSHSVMFLGDTYFGEYYDNDRKRRGMTHYLNRYGYQHSLKNFGPILADSDVTIANFEATLTSQRISPLRGKKSWILPASPRPTLDTLRTYNIDVLGLGNNHVVDFGKANLAESLDILNREEYPFFGAGSNEAEAIKPLKISLAGFEEESIFVFTGYTYNKVSDSTFGSYASKDMPGVANVHSEEFLDEIRKTKALYPNAFIIVQPHWAPNYKFRTEKQRVWAKKYIDAGASLIIGHGAHMTQEIENIDGVWVIYSLGNFVFNSNGEYNRRNVPPFSLAAKMQLKLGVHGVSKVLKIYPFYCANHSCGFQPRFANSGEFEHICDKVLLGGQSYHRDPRVDVGKDFFGSFISLSI